MNDKLIGMDPCYQSQPDVDLISEETSLSRYLTKQSVNSKLVLISSQDHQR